VTPRVSAAALVPAWLVTWLARLDPLLLYAAVLTLWNVLLALRFLRHQARELRLERENAAFRAVLQRLGIDVALPPTPTGMEITGRLAEDAIVPPGPSRSATS
jgi:hypothetical protein